MKHPRALRVGGVSVEQGPISNDVADWFGESDHIELDQLGDSIHTILTSMERGMKRSQKNHELKTTTTGKPSPCNKKMELLYGASQRERLRRRVRPAPFGCF